MRSRKLENYTANTRSPSCNAGKRLPHSQIALDCTTKNPLLGELQAGDRAGNHVFLNLHQIRVCQRHAKNRVHAPTARNVSNHAGSIFLVHASAKPSLNRADTGNRDALFVQWAEVVHHIVQPLVGDVHYVRERLASGFLPDQ